MSALVIRRRSHNERRAAFIGCDTPGRLSFMDSKKRAGSHTGKAPASASVLLCGYHAAYLCDSCVRAWRKTWIEAGGDEA